MSESKEVQHWADEFMFTAETSDAMAGPQAFLLSATPDPLGSIAVAAEAYMGRFYESKDDITDDQRRYYLEQIQKTKLKMPMEAVSFHWRIKGITRSFTHQMVRQRTAAYSQESMRFAVKEDAAVAVALPPSLQQFYGESSVPGKATRGDALWDTWRGLGSTPDKWDLGSYPSDKEGRWYIMWRESVEFVAQRYTALVNDSMPAEDARGLTPHNIVTQLNYITNLRNYQDHAGNRLCTQAQFEWRTVWTSMLKVMREHCSCPTGSEAVGRSKQHTHNCDNWQWVALSEIFLPVCYQMGKCQFEAEFDRKCSIRERVNANAEIGRDSSEWHRRFYDVHKDDDTGNDVGAGEVNHNAKGETVFIGAIHPAEWLMDDSAAR